MSQKIMPKQVTRPEPREQAQAQAQAQPLQVSISIPIDKCFPGLAVRSVDCKFTMRQAAALKIAWSSCSEHAYRFQGGVSSNPNGQVVENLPGFVRWIADQLADAIEQATGKSVVDDFDLIF